MRKKREIESRKERERSESEKERTQAGGGRGAESVGEADTPLSRDPDHQAPSEDSGIIA